MPEYEYIEVTSEDRVTTITLDRPDKLNALNHGLLDELNEALNTAEESGERVVILTGNGRAFSSGYDFASEGGAETPDERMKDDSAHLDTIYNLSIPVIAAVDGYALAGGTNLAIACDITYATADSEFGFPDVHMGTLPARFILPHVGGSLKHARELLYSGKHVDAAEAERMGFVNKAVADEEELMELVHEEAKNIKLTPSTVVKLLKDGLNNIQEGQGYRANSSGAIDRYMMILTMETEASNRFHEIQEEDGLQAAMEWMNTAEKE